MSQKPSRQIGKEEDQTFFKENAGDHTVKEWSDIFGISIAFIKKKGDEWRLTFKKAPRKEYVMTARYPEGRKYEKTMAPVAPQRPPAEYSNHSPMGVADKLR